MCHKHGAKMIQDEQDQFDPLHKNVIVTREKTFIQYNHVEGFDFAPDEMQEIFHQALLEERANPTLKNKAKCFDIFKSMIGEYWAGQREACEKMVAEAERA